MFGFGSCGSWSIWVRLGLVFGRLCIDICFFSGVGKANTDCFPQEVSLLHPASGFMSSGCQRAERAELGKPKFPEIVSAGNLI
jgi:hypothetical protein